MSESVGTLPNVSPDDTVKSRKNKMKSSVFIFVVLKLPLLVHQTVLTFCKTTAPYVFKAAIFTQLHTVLAVEANKPCCFSGRHNWVMKVQHSTVNEMLFSGTFDRRKNEHEASRYEHVYRTQRKTRIFQLVHIKTA